MAIAAGRGSSRATRTVKLPSNGRGVRYTCEATPPDVDGPFTNVATVTAIDGLGASLAATDDVLVARTSGGPAVVEPAPEPEPQRQQAFTGFDAVSASSRT